jgi:hypothetical protein
LIQAALRWVRASRFRREDDHRLAYVVVPELVEPDLVATFLLTVQDGTGARHERFTAVRITPALEVSQDPEADEAASRADQPGNVAPELLERLFRSWWEEARARAETEAARRAGAWVEELAAFRGLEKEFQRPELARWDKATKEAILGEYARAAAQPGLFGQEPALPPAIRRRLDEHRKRVEFQRSLLERRAHFEPPQVEALGVLLRVPAHLTQENR